MDFTATLALASTLAQPLAQAGGLPFIARVEDFQEVLQYHRKALEPSAKKAPILNSLWSCSGSHPSKSEENAREFLKPDR